MTLRDRGLFLRWAIVNALYLVGLGAARVSYHGHVKAIAWASIGAVLATYAAASAVGGYVAWHDRLLDRRLLRHLSLAIELAPKLAMIGTVGGFLIAFSKGASDVQGRVLGASTGLAATFIGISAMVVLEVIRHLLEPTQDPKFPGYGGKA
jgi:hypothetical protein